MTRIIHTAIGLAAEYALNVLTLLQVVTPCTDNQRTKTYYWKTPKVCVDGAVLPPTQTGLPCDCLESDYFKDAESCTESTTTSTATFLVQPRSECTGGVSPPPDTTVPCFCTAADVVTAYSECGPDNTRTQVSLLAA